MTGVGVTILLGLALGVGAFSVWNPTTHYPLPTSSPAPSPAFLLPIAQAAQGPIRDFNIPDPELVAKAAILVDAKSTRTLYAKNATERLPIASITKLMTAMVVTDQLDLRATYTVVPEALNVDGTGADFVAGERIVGSELLKIMLIKSSNDAAVIFAENATAAGIDLIAEMNRKADELGMRDTHFNDPAGLDDRATYSTVHDLVKLITAADAYPQITVVLRTPRADVRSADGTRMHHLVSTNKLLSSIAGIVLGKTGNTDGAGGTMALKVALPRDDALISIVLGSGDRFGETKQLIDWGKHAHRWSE